MKTLLIAISFVLATAFNLQAQDHVQFNTLVVQEEGKEYVEFTMANSLTDIANERKSFYTDYFDVRLTSVAKSTVVRCDLKGDDLTMSKKVILRYLSSMGIKNIRYQNENYTLKDFFNRFILA